MISAVNRLSKNNSVPNEKQIIVIPNSVCPMNVVNVLGMIRDLVKFRGDPESSSG